MALTKVIGNGTGDLTQLQILNGSNVRAASSDADDLIVEGPADCGISILSATTGRIYFGDAANDDAGSIRYVHSDDSMRFETNDVEAMRISSIGAVTKPLQPAFSAYLSANQDNFALNSTVTVAFDTEFYDVNADFNTSNYTFTAPVTGKYQINITLRFNNADTAAPFYQTILTTSNRGYAVFTIDPNYAADPAYLHGNASILVDMDASDTATVGVYQNNGTQQTDISSGTDCVFSGFLAC